MGLIRVWPGGTSISYPAGTPPKPGIKQEINGWTAASSRGLVRFLWSVNPDKLESGGLAITLTMGGRPESSAEWAAAREAFLKWLRDTGSLRWQWLTEWTANARPHMHLCVFNTGVSHNDIAVAWLKICAKHGWPASLAGQSVENLFDATGWLKYVAKHSARGVEHYQRETPPPGWEKTGRLWGYGSHKDFKWPREEPEDYSLTREQSLAFTVEFIELQAAQMIEAGVPAEFVLEWIERATEPPEKGAPPRGLSGWIDRYASRGLIESVTRAEGS